ncbi:hypothetical protein M406DRAFT_74051, partial [Cryphonectria parasitica EP155]
MAVLKFDSGDKVIADVTRESGAKLKIWGEVIEKQQSSSHDTNTYKIHVLKKMDIPQTMSDKGDAWKDSNEQSEWVAEAWVEAIPDTFELANYDDMLLCDTDPSTAGRSVSQPAGWSTGAAPNP